jgi:hypothetical protein
MPNRASREAKVEFELGHLIKKILEKKGFTVEGVLNRLSVEKNLDPFFILW